MLKKITLALLTCLLVSLLFIDVPHLIPFRLMLTLWSIGHIVVFAFFAGLQLTFSANLKNASFIKQFAWLTATSIFIGVSIELIQPFFSRTAELEDLFFNYLGTLAILIFMGNLPASKSVNNSIKTLYMLVLIYLIKPALLTAYDEYRMHKDFPIISSYYNETALTRWKADFPVKLAPQKLPFESQNRLLQTTFVVKKASRVVMRFFNGNWQAGQSQGYSKVQLRFYNPQQQTLPLTVIMTDEFYGKSTANWKYRFSTKINLPHGWSSHFIKLEEIQKKPEARDIDLSKMAGIDFYMYKLKTPTSLYIDEIKLLR